MVPLAVSISAYRPSASFSSCANTEYVVNAVTRARAPLRLWFIFAIKFMGRQRKTKNTALRNVLFVPGPNYAFGIDREQVTPLAPGL